MVRCFNLSAGTRTYLFFSRKKNWTIKNAQRHSFADPERSFALAHAQRLTESQFARAKRWTIKSAEQLFCGLAPLRRAGFVPLERKLKTSSTLLQIIWIAIFPLLLNTWKNLIKIPKQIFIILWLAIGLFLEFIGKLFKL